MAATPTVVMSRPRRFSVGTDDQAGTNSDAPEILVMFDAVVQETHTKTNTVTPHPVEEGSDITDHSRPEPDEVSLECWISNTPLSLSQQTRIVKQGGTQIQTTAEAAAPRDQPGYAQQAADDLRQLQESSALVTIVTTVRTYRSMAITGVTQPVTSADYDAAHFTLTARKIVVVRNKLTRTVKAKDKRVGRKVKKGTVTPAEAAAPESESILRKVARAALGAATGTP